MSKKISIFLDGTWNTPESQTNVYKLFSITQGEPTGPDLKKLEHPAWRKIYHYLRNKLLDEDIDHERLDKEYQKLRTKKSIRYYDPGVGTRFLNRVRGGALGKGVSENILQAYYFLCHLWEPGDEIYVFGFSRGAYTARSLVGLLDLVGLMESKLCRTSENREQVIAYLHKYIEYLHNLNQKQLGYGYKNIAKPIKPELLAKIPESRQNIPVKFTGVWDTVGSLGIPNRFKHFLQGLVFNVYETLGNTELCENVEYAYHAMAIDEHRVDFQVTPWTYPHDSTELPDQVKEVEQCWFVGAHANIGGGYKGNFLSDFACQWLQQKAITVGLEFSTDYQINSDAIDSEVADSYAEFAGGIHQYFNKPVLRTINFESIPTKGQTINETIHPSVWNYYINGTEYKPENIPNSIVAMHVPTNNDNDPIV